MDARPRLRLLRRSPSPRRVADTDADATPQPARSSFLAVRDVDDDEAPTPRVLPKSIADFASSADTPAARLRALLAREPRSPKSSHTPAPPSEADSATESARFGSSTSSVTRDSLRDIFSRALREPGDTPQKGRLRRNSFDGSPMEITPVVSRDRGQHRAARRSLSDEEAENSKSSRQAEPSFRLSTAITFDTLRARLLSSRSQLMDQNPPDALYNHTSLASTSTAPRPSQASTSARADQPLSTPHPSFQMSSQLAFQSNLLEQDSEMQRAMGNVLNSDNEGSTSTPNVPQSTMLPFDSRPSFSLQGIQNGSKQATRRTTNELDSSSSSSSVHGPIEGGHHSQESNDQRRERDWDRPRPLSVPNIPEAHRRHSQESHRRLSQEFRSSPHTKSVSHESQSSVTKPIHQHLERRSSIASLRSFDDDHSSRPSSTGSQADYQDRISELDQERNYEREREWNKRHPPSRPSSSLSTSSSHSFTHSHSYPPRSPSATPYLTPTHASLQRKSSRTSLRSDSPASLASSQDSVKEREQEQTEESVHERERNWNSPRPHWSTSKSPPTQLKVRNKDSDSLRSSSSLPHLRDSNGRSSTSWVPTKRQSPLPRADSPSTTPPVMSRRSGLEEKKVGISFVQSKDSSPGKTPGAASKFGWNFPRSPLPPLELDDSAGHHHRSTTSPSPGSRPSGRSSENVVSSQIPVRFRMKNFSSVGHATSDMSLTHVVGGESSQQDYESSLYEPLEPQNRTEPHTTGGPWSQEDMVVASDEEPVIDDDPLLSTTPKSKPPISIPEETDTDAETEVLMSPSPRGSPELETSAPVTNQASHQEVNDLAVRVQALKSPLEEPLASATPPNSPPSAGLRSQLLASPSVALVTPPRQASLGNSISVLDFRTPSPPHDLPDLPGPPLSSDDDTVGNTPIKGRHFGADPEFTFTKTPKPPGAWAATPLPSKYDRRPSSPTGLFPLESTPPASTSTPLPRATSYPPLRTDITDQPDEDELLTPVGTLSRAKSLPLRTPAPPGAWVTTPGQSALLGNGVDQSQFGSLGRRKGLLKVRFDVAESETSATEGHSNSPLTTIRSVNPDLPIPKPTADHGSDGSTEMIVNEVLQSGVSHRPATPDRSATPVSRDSGLSPRSLRKSPSIRLVDAYGRERTDEEGAAKLLIGLPNGYAEAERKTAPSPSTPRRNSVRIVDAMGKEVDDGAEDRDASDGRADRSSEADVSVTLDDIPIGHAEALARMRKTLRDLAESLSETDKSEDLDLNSSHLEQLEEVSRAARLARNQLAHNLHLETEKERDRSSTQTHGLSSKASKKSWNATLVYCGIAIYLLFVLAMWRYAHVEARRLFYTTYYDPLYPELTPIQEGSCFSGTLSTSRPWAMFDSYEIIRREGWHSIRKEILRAMKHVGDRAWERWGENVQFEKPT